MSKKFIVQTITDNNKSDEKFNNQEEAEKYAKQESRKNIFNEYRVCDNSHGDMLLIVSFKGGQEGYRIK